jgi:hypothetical protein
MQIDIFMFALNSLLGELERYYNLTIPAWLTSAWSPIYLFTYLPNLTIYKQWIPSSLSFGLFIETIWQTL